jgi:hypothetical protein
MTTTMLEPRGDAVPTADQLSEATFAIVTASESIETLEMNASRLVDDDRLRLDAAAAWHLHIACDNVRMQAERLIAHARSIDRLVDEAWTTQEGGA